jgi:hypothetical protein
MKINYRVLSYNEKDHSMSVRYWTDILSEDDLNALFDEYNNIVYNSNGYPVRTKTDMNITFYNNPNPSSNDIVNLIQKNVPTSWIYNLEQTKISNTEYSLANVASFVGVSNNFQVNTEIFSNASRSVSNNEIQKEYMERAAKIAIRYIQTGVYDLGNTKSYVIQ